MHSIGFGIERLGLVAIRYPRRTLAALLAFTIFCISGLFSLQPEGRLSEIYRGNSQNYADYKQISDLFPSSELDLFLLISGKDLLSREKIDQLRSLQEEVEFADGVAGTLSIFSLRGAPDPSKKDYSPPLFPADVDALSDAEFATAMQAVSSHPDALGKMLTKADADGKQTCLIVVTLKEESVSEGTLWGVLDKLEKTTRDLAAPAGFEVRLAGMPFFQQEIRNAINRDLVVFNVSGIIIGVLICIYFIRQPIFVFMTTLGSTMAIIWVFGLLGHFGQSVNGFITIIPPLILVVTVSDGMHLVLDVYRQLREGVDKETALRHSITTVGPACVLTSITTALAMGTLALTDSAVLFSFGLAAASGTLLGFVAVVVLLPALSMLLIHDESKFRASGSRDPAALLDGLERLTMRLADWIVPKWRPLLLGGIALTVLFASLHLQLQPKYRLADEIPNRPALNETIDFINQHFGGGDHVNILISYGKDRTATSPDVLEAIRDAHDLLGSFKQVSEVDSLEKTRQWFHEYGIDSPDALQEYVAQMPDYVRSRFVNTDAHAAVVSGKIPDLQTEELRELNTRIKAALVSMRRDYPGFEFTVAGMSSLTALQSSSIIGQLNMSLVLAILLVIPLLGIAFRSFDIALISVLPNLFPLFAAGTLLYLSGSGLQYASVLGFTIAFGIAVDDSIHFINRYYQEGKSGISDIERVHNTLGHIGPALMLTTLVILFGLSITVFSDLGVTRLFGTVTMITLAAALVADLVLTPAVTIGISRLHQWSKRMRGAVRVANEVLHTDEPADRAKPGREASRSAQPSHPAAARAVVRKRPSYKGG